jgi:hypothetical protein
MSDITEEKKIELMTSIHAKEKGFNWRTTSFYENGEFKERDRNPNIETWDHNSSFKERTSAPTQTHLQKWLREVHNLHANPYMEGEAGEPELNLYTYFIHQGMGNRIKSKMIFPSFESALEYALLESLNLIK